ncbi:helix-turn-helix domain-containing protein [Flammeovirga pacifica]|uniref:HTH araC/xylS-type domain-containing protein n=1 Tax=Flammeovirga pacifica TaxID=915059 RepID=A0A1S1Z0C3_FLAPC|nr:AraC family transcriptional regulator [Flammeovirga pacifica]OHX66701.1 hypothetical protein NH26_10190 [Flammeovirga pacifica]
MEYQYTIEGNELHPKALYNKIAKDLKGSWDNETLTVKNSWCDIEAHSFQFFEEMYISVSSLFFKKPVLFKSINNKSDETFFTIKIGFTGSFFGKDDQYNFNNLGVFFYNSLQNFDIQYPIETNCKWLSITFSLNLFKQLVGNSTSKIDELILDNSAWFKYYSLDIEIENLVRAINSNLDKKKRRNIYFLTKSLEIIGLINEKMIKDSSLFKKNIHEDDLKKMMHLKEHHLSNFSIQPNLNELSFEYGMSVSKLNRIFKSIFDKPVLQFYNQQKIEEAYRQITHTSKSITEISMDLNFTNVGYMSKMFKQYYGFPPSVLKEG